MHDNKNSLKSSIFRVSIISIFLVISLLTYPYMAHPYFMPFGIQNWLNWGGLYDPSIISGISNEFTIPWSPFGMWGGCPGLFPCPILSDPLGLFGWTASNGQYNIPGYLGRPFGLSLTMPFGGFGLLYYPSLLNETTTNGVPGTIGISGWPGLGYCPFGVCGMGMPGLGGLNLMQPLMMPSFGYQGLRSATQLTPTGVQTALLADPVFSPILTGAEPALLTTLVNDPVLALALDIYPNFLSVAGTYPPLIYYPILLTSPYLWTDPVFGFELLNEFYNSPFGTLMGTEVEGLLATVPDLATIDTLFYEFLTLQLAYKDFIPWEFFPGVVPSTTLWAPYTPLQVEATLLANPIFGPIVGADTILLSTLVNSPLLQTTLGVFPNFVSFLGEEWPLFQYNPLLLISPFLWDNIAVIGLSEENPLAGTAILGSLFNTPNTTFDAVTALEILAANPDLASIDPIFYNFLANLINLGYVPWK